MSLFVYEYTLTQSNLYCQESLLQRDDLPKNLFKITAEDRRVQKVHFRLSCVGQKRRSSMSNDEIKVWASARATALVRGNYALKSHACIYTDFFSAIFAGPLFVEIQIMLP